MLSDSAGCRVSPEDRGCSSLAGVPSEQLRCPSQNDVWHARPLRHLQSIRPSGLAGLHLVGEHLIMAPCRGASIVMQTVAFGIASAASASSWKCGADIGAARQPTYVMEILHAGLSGSTSHHGSR